MSWDRERVVLERLALSWDQEREGGTGKVGIVLGSRERALLESRHCLGIKREGTAGEVGIVLGSRERAVLER